MFSWSYQIETNLTKLTASFTETVFDEICFSLTLVNFLKNKLIKLSFLAKIKPLRL